MYEVKVSGKTLYYPANTLYTIYNAQLELDVGLAGAFKFDVPSTNPEYSSVTQGAIITILKNGVEYWRGEVKETTIDINKVMNVYVLEDLAWLADEFLFPESDTTKTYSQKYSSVISTYNANRSSDRQFTVGYITNVNNADYCNWVTEYDWSILDSIRNCICLDSGYLRVRRVTSGGVVTRYIDCVKISDYGSLATQKIRFGVNLLDYVEEMNMDNFVNVLTPYGAETNTELYADYNQRLAGTVITNAASVTAYGRHAKAVIFETDDLTTLNNLASAYLTRYSQPQLTMNLDAIDLAEISSETSFNIGDSINVIAEPFAIDQILYLTSQTIDLQDASQNKVTLSGYVKRQTSITNQAIDTASLVKSLPSRSSILDAARKNALALLLDETQGGYVVFEYDASNENMEAINILNAKTIDEATKRWKWSQNGFGYMHRDNKTDPWQGPTVAMTMDGGIVADFITSGTMSCDRLNGGKIYGQEIEGGNIKGTHITSEASGTKVEINGGQLIVYDSASNYLHVYKNGDSTKYLCLGSMVFGGSGYDRKNGIDRFCELDTATVMAWLYDNIPAARLN